MAEKRESKHIVNFSSLGVVVNNCPWEVPIIVVPEKKKHALKNIFVSKQRNAQSGSILFIMNVFGIMSRNPVTILRDAIVNCSEISDHLSTWA